MRRTLLFIVLFTGAALASDDDTTRPATPAEADFIYLNTLNSTPADVGIETLIDAGIDAARARQLLTFLDERIEARRQQALADTVGLCRNLDDRFSTPLALARELIRQRESENAFKDTLIRGASQILNAASLERLRQQSMNMPTMIPGPDVVDLVLEGQLTPAAAIARACDVTLHDRAGVLDRSEAL